MKTETDWRGRLFVVVLIVDLLLHAGGYLQQRFRFEHAGRCVEVPDHQ